MDKRFVISDQGGKEVASNTKEKNNGDLQKPRKQGYNEWASRQTTVTPDIAMTEVALHWPRLDAL